MWNKISGDESNSSPLVNTSGGSFSSKFRAFFWNQAGECLISCPRSYTCSHRFNSRQQMHFETWTGVLVAIALSIAAANCEHRANRVGNPPATDDYYCFFTESVSNCWKCPYSGPAILWNFLFNYQPYMKLWLVNCIDLMPYTHNFVEWAHLSVKVISSHV